MASPKFTFGQQIFEDLSLIERRLLVSGKNFRGLVIQVGPHCSHFPREFFLRYLNKVTMQCACTSIWSRFLSGVWHRPYPVWVSRPKDQVVSKTIFTCMAYISYYSSTPEHDVRYVLYTNFKPWRNSRSYLGTKKVLYSSQIPSTLQKTRTSLIHVDRPIVDAFWSNLDVFVRFLCQIFPWHSKLEYWNNLLIRRSLLDNTSLFTGDRSTIMTESCVSGCFNVAHFMALSEFQI